MLLPHKGWERQVWNCFWGLRYLIQHNVLMYAVPFSEGSCFAMQTCFSSLFLSLHKDPLCLSSILLTEWLKGGVLPAKEGEEHERNEKQHTSRNYCIRSFHPVHLLLTYCLAYSTITSQQLYHMLTYVNTHSEKFSRFHEMLFRTDRFNSIYRGKSL